MTDFSYGGWRSKGEQMFKDVEVGALFTHSMFHALPLFQKVDSDRARWIDVRGELHTGFIGRSSQTRYWMLEWVPMPRVPDDVPGFLTNLLDFTDIPMLGSAS